MRTLSLLALLLSTAPASTREWYDPKCCNDQDCAPIADCGEIHSAPAGGLTWNNYSFSRETIFPSHDAKCHVCLHKTNTRVHPLCIYIQQGS